MWTDQLICLKPDSDLIDIISIGVGPESLSWQCRKALRIIFGI